MKDNKPKDFIPGDDVCKSCTGIVYFTKSMRAKGDVPVCIGKKTTLTKKIPVDKLEELDKKTNKKDLEVYICLGYSQTSGRMERTGKVPICISGVQFHFVASDMSKSNGKDAKSVSGNPAADSNGNIASNNLLTGSALTISKSNIDYPNKETVSDSLSTTKLMLSSWAKLIEKGMKKQVNSMIKFYNQTADKFPEKCMKSVGSLTTSAGKTFERLERGVLKLWSSWR